MGETNKGVPTWGEKCQCRLGGFGNNGTLVFLFFLYLVDGLYLFFIDIKVNLANKTRERPERTNQKKPGKTYGGREVENFLLDEELCLECLSIHPLALIIKIEPHNPSYRNFPSLPFPSLPFPSICVLICPHAYLDFNWSGSQQQQIIEQILTKYQYQIRCIFMIKIKERICLKEEVKEREIER